MSVQDIFGIVAILYCVANLGSMGLELSLPETIKALRSARLVTLTLAWSWIGGSDESHSNRSDVKLNRMEV